MFNGNAQRKRQFPPNFETLDGRKRRFAHVLAETGKPHNAARASGLVAREAQDDPQTRQFIREALHARLMRLAPIALGVLHKLATDENVSPAVRRLAAADILDRAGIVSLAPQTAKADGLSAMSAPELHALVNRLETELFDRAKPVESPEIALIEAKPLSVLD